MNVNTQYKLNNFQFNPLIFFAYWKNELVNFVIENLEEDTEDGLGNFKRTFGK